MLRAHSHDRDVVISKAVVELRTTRLVSSGKVSRAPAHNQNVHKERCMPRGANVHPSPFGVRSSTRTNDKSILIFWKNARKEFLAVDELSFALHRRSFDW